MKKSFVKAKTRFNVLERDGFRCVYCGKSAKDGVCLSVSFHEDHVFPKSRGGLDQEDNLVSCCSDCNIGKGDRLLTNLPDAIPCSVAHTFEFAKSMKSQKAQILTAWERQIIIHILGYCSRMTVEYLVSLCRQDWCMDTPEGRAVIEFSDHALRVPGWFPISDLLGSERLGIVIKDEVLRKELNDLSDLACGVSQGDEDIAAFVRWVEQGIDHRRNVCECDAVLETLRSERLDPESEGKLLDRLVAMRRVAQGMDKKEDHSDGR